jgi:MFS family permease
MPVAGSTSVRKGTAAMTAAPVRAPLGASRARLVVAVLAFSSILVSVPPTMLVPLYGELPQLFDTSASNASWAVTATLLVAAVATPISGRLGDMYGKRRMMLVCLALLVVGSLVVATTSHIGVVVFGRALQGVASGLLPLAMAILRDELPPSRIPGSVALISASLGAGASFALPLSAIVAETADWHWIFLGTAVVAAISLVAVAVVVPESPIRNPGRFDFIGAAGIAVGLPALLLAVSKGEQWGWGSPAVTGLAVGGVVVLVLWCRYERTRHQPLVDIAVSAAPPVLVTNAASLLGGFVFISTTLMLPQLLQAPEESGYGLGQTLIATGLCLMPAGIVQVLQSPLAGWLVRRFGPKATLAIGMAILAVSFAVALVTLHAVWQVVLVSVIGGMGAGFAFSAMPVLIMGAVPVSESAAANALNSLSRAVGASAASAVIGVVLASGTVVVAGMTIPSHRAFQLSLALGLVVAIVATVLALLIPRPPGVAEAVSLDPADHITPAGVID